jgi:hypothetical protein
VLSLPLAMTRPLLALFIGGLSAYQHGDCRDHCRPVVKQRGWCCRCCCARGTFGGAGHSSRLLLGVGAPPS